MGIKMWAKVAKNRENLEFLLTIVPHETHPPCAIFTKLVEGEGVPGLYPHAKLHGCGFKNVGLQATPIEQD